MLTFGSLFAGIGGFDLGFERAGLECRWQVEIDDYAVRVLEKHWPKVKRWRDVRTFPSPFRNPRQWEVDVICGGFPCQDISSNNQYKRGINGEQSNLFHQVVRIIRILRPRVVVLENVADLLVRGLDVVLGELAACGFDARWECFPAAAIGNPQRRWRTFVIAYADGERFESCNKWLSSRQNDSEWCKHDGLVPVSLAEWMMGFPEGWTDLDASETPSSPKSQSGSENR